MYCSRCTNYVAVNEKCLNLERSNIRGYLTRLDCNVCKNFLGIVENGEIVDIDERLDTIIENGWKKVRTEREKICHYILSQIIYPEIDTPNIESYESLYDFADDFDEIILRWENGRPIGFYTIKLKGKFFGRTFYEMRHFVWGSFQNVKNNEKQSFESTEICTTKSEYSMPTVDTVYVRSEYRNRGIGSEILSDVISRFPVDDIGFSKPISNGMLRVLKRFLTEHKEYRLRFWEIEDGDESSQKLVWFLVRNQN